MALFSVSLACRFMNLSHYAMRTKKIHQRFKNSNFPHHESPLDKNPCPWGKEHHGEARQVLSSRSCGSGVFRGRRRIHVVRHARASRGGVPNIRRRRVVADFQLRFSNALAAPVFGYLSDRIDRVRLLLFALPAFAIDGMGIALAPNLEAAMALRVFGGIASAALIPTAFALVSEIVPRERRGGRHGAGHVRHDPRYRVGSGAGRAAHGVVGLANAVPRDRRRLHGRFSDWFENRSPPAFRSGGGRVPPISLVWELAHPAAFDRERRVERDGRGGLLLSGEILGRRHNLGVAEVGMTVTAFGIGLGIGNLCAGRLRRVCGREEISLVATTGLLAAAVATFVLFPLPLAGSFGCLIAWEPRWGPERQAARQFWPNGRAATREWCWLSPKHSTMSSFSASFRPRRHCSTKATTRESWRFWGSDFPLERVLQYSTRP